MTLALRSRDYTLGERGILKKIFNDSDGTYGPDHICGVLRNRGHKAPHTKVSRIMAELVLIYT